jgi:hypothetical protein
LELGTIFIEIQLKRGFILLFLLVFVSVKAQNNESQLISRHRPGLFWFFDGLRPTKSTDNHKYDRLIIDLTYNDWSGDLKPFQNRWNSLGMNVNFMKDMKFKKTKWFSLGLGIGYGFSTMSSDSRFKLNKSLIEIENLEKSGLFDYASTHAHRFYIPFELRFSTNNWKRIKFSLGANIGINSGINQSLLGRDGSKKEEISLTHSAPAFNYGLHCRFGLRNIALFSSYQLSNFFRDSSNPKLHQIQFGLSISIF